MKNDNFKETNTYKFFEDIICDITDEYTVNSNKQYDIEKTIANIMEDDQLWDDLVSAIGNNLVEMKEEER